MRARLSETCGKHLPPIFSLSARDGLAGKLAGDPQAVVASGVGEFETELTRFLIEEKSVAFLRGVYGRTAQLLDSLGGDAGGDLRTRLARLSAHDCTPEPTSPEANAIIAGERSVMEDCSVCVHVAESLFDFLRGYQYDLVFDADVRERFTSSGGLCAPHLWLYASVASNRDVCMALAPLIKRLAAVLRAMDSSSASLRTRAECRLCLVQDEAERRALAELEGSRARALCLPHLRALAECTGDRPLLRVTAQRQAAAAERLAEDMRRYVLRHDALRRGLASEEETEAARRALSFVAGHRAIAAPQRAR